MCMEVFPFCLTSGETGDDFLHVHGGVSVPSIRPSRSSKFSPCAWRCFQDQAIIEDFEEIFSMCMEVFPFCLTSGETGDDFLHVHGGVSVPSIRPSRSSKFSPCAWRCFLISAIGSELERIFSMCMEVFLSRADIMHGLKNFLHVHGGVSNSGTEAYTEGKFSPCAWRCFLLCWF